MKALLLTLSLALSLTCSSMAGAMFVAGTYTGFADLGSDDLSQAGSAKITTTSSGGYSITGRLGPKKFSTKGTFDGAGHVDKTVAIKVFGFTVATIHIVLQLSGDAESIDATVTVNDNDPVHVVLYRAFFSKTSPTTKEGRFTALLPSPGGAFPGGTGYATITISSAGLVKVVGKLSDGAVISTGGSLRKDNSFPIINLLYKKHGVIGGYITFTSDDAASGMPIWLKVDDTSSHNFIFHGNVTMNVARYTKPETGTVALPGLNSTGDANVTLTGGNLTATFTKAVRVSTANKVSVVTVGDDKLKAKISTKTGSVSGTAKVDLSGTTKTVTFRGVIFQSGNKAEGFFIGTDSSGKFTLAP